MSVVGVVGILVFSLLPTINLAAKEQGPYFHVGISYWGGLDALDDTSRFQSRLPGFETPGWESVVSKIEIPWGIGYNFNDRWGIEITWDRISEQSLPGSHELIPSAALGPDDDPIYTSWTYTRTVSYFAISAVYDFYFHDDISVFGKIGIASIGRSWDLESSIPKSVDNILLHSLLNDQLPAGNTGDLVGFGGTFGGIGVRIPLMQTKHSLTFGCHVLNSDEGTAVSLEIALQFTLK